MNNREIVNKFRNEATSGKSGNIFIEGNNLYSYGKHFILAVRMQDVYLLNGDSYSKSTSKHQSIVRSVLKPNFIIPFSALRQVTTEYEKLVILDKTEDTIKEVKYIDSKTGEEKTRENHLLGAILFKVFKYDSVSRKERDFYYLGSCDETAKTIRQGYFIIELPNKAKSVTQAYESLKPKGLGAEYEYQRQGEFFLIPSEVKTKDLRPNTEKNLAVLFGNDSDSGNPHIAKETRQKGKDIYIRGTLKHREHKTINFKSWHIVKINQAVHSYSASGRVD